MHAFNFLPMLDWVTAGEQRVWTVLVLSQVITLLNWCSSEDYIAEHFLKCFEGLTSAENLDLETENKQVLILSKAGQILHYRIPGWESPVHNQGAILNTVHST